MKKQLLLIILPILLFSVTIQGQTKVWDFSDETKWPISPGIPASGGPVVVDKLLLQPHNSSDNFGEISASSQTFSDGFVSVNRLRSNGSSGDDITPIRRFMKFIVTGNVDIKIWFKTGGDGARTLIVSDGVSVIGSITKNRTADIADDDPDIFTVSYTGGDSDIYVHGDSNFAYYKIEVSGPGASDLVLSTNNAVSQVSTNVKAIGNQIHVSNVKLATAINIYSITGALVKTVEVSNDTSFSLKSGLYIATVKTAEGQKSVKLVLR